jgi:hypothetical protein
MKRNFTHENFEHFLRQNADGLRMQPSQKVWKGITSHLNRRRRRFGLLVGMGLLITTGIGYYYSNSRDQISNDITATQVQKDRLSHEGSLNSIAVDHSIKIIPLNVNSKTVKPKAVPASNLENILVYTSGNSPEPASAFQIDFEPTIIDTYPGGQAIENNSTVEPVRSHPLNPMTIESVMNSYHPMLRSRRFGMEVYFTPTVSYRKLNDNNIDNVVTHKPDFGFELGVAAKYRVGRNVKVRGGLQFNVNRYDIKTYNATTQMATIRLTNRFGFDSVNTVTNYNNFSGYKSNWLENFFFQVSAPVGLELKLRGDERTQFGIASTIQPTYILGDRAYLISSDYKNYAEVPRLIRRWNVNTSFETFVAYSTGKLKWQVGPQVRYQLLSSYLKKYPVKENLFDFGLKVGVSLNNH